MSKIFTASQSPVFPYLLPFSLWKSEQTIPLLKTLQWCSVCLWQNPNALIHFQSLSWSGPLLPVWLHLWPLFLLILFFQIPKVLIALHLCYVLSWFHEIAQIFLLPRILFFCVFFFFANNYPLSKISIDITSSRKVSLVSIPTAESRVGSWPRYYLSTLCPSSLALMALCWWLGESWNFTKDSSDSRALSLAMVQYCF